MAENAAHRPHGLVFLVHGECECGWKMAAPEGSTWPLCPDCGKQVMPLKPVPPDERAEGWEDTSGRLGYYLAPEQEALAKAREYRRG